MRMEWFLHDMYFKEVVSYTAWLGIRCADYKIKSQNVTGHQLVIILDFNMVISTIYVNMCNPGIMVYAANWILTVDTVSNEVGTNLIPRDFPLISHIKASEENPWVRG